MTTPTSSNNNALSFKSTLDDLQIKDFSLMLDTESEEEEEASNC
jgi:hypothetical protein